jgi:hypothetical protein
MSHLNRKAKDFWLLTGAIAALSLLLGCSKPHPQPELLDPIYADLVSRSNVSKAAAHQANAELVRARESLATAPPRDPTRRKLQQDISKHLNRITVADQEAIYYEVRANQRRDYARSEYLKAYNRGESWPNPADFEAYKTQKRLQEAPRDWGAHLKKTNRYNHKSPEE